jgi:hypothetical protein
MKRKIDPHGSILLTALAWGFLLSFSACDSNRIPSNYLDCEDSRSSTLPLASANRYDSLGILILPEGKWIPIKEGQSNRLALNRKGRFSIVQVSKTVSCRGSSELIFQVTDDPKTLNLNFIYNGKKADTDTLSVLGLLPFEHRLVEVRERNPTEQGKGRFRFSLRID